MAVQFDGSAHIVYGGVNEDLDFLNGQSEISAFVRAYLPGEMTGDQFFFGDHRLVNGALAGMSLWGDAAGSGINDDATSVSGGDPLAAGNQTVPEGRWGSLGLTWENATNGHKIYVDGSEAASLTPSNSTFLGGGGAATKIGQRPSYTSMLLVDGARVADCAIWLRKLSANEMLALHNGYSPLFFPVLALYIPLWTADQIDAVVNTEGWTGVGQISGGTLTTAPHPRVVVPYTPNIITAPAGAPAGTWPHGPLGHPLHGAFGGPI